MMNKERAEYRRVNKKNYLGRFLPSFNSADSKAAQYKWTDKTKEQVMVQFKALTTETTWHLIDAKE